MTFFMNRSYSWWAVRIVVIMFAVCAPLLYLFHSPNAGLAFASISAFVLAIAWARKLIDEAETKFSEN